MKEKAVSHVKLTLVRVAAAMGGVLPTIGTSSVPPKPRGKSQGLPAGKARLRIISLSDSPKRYY